MGEGVVVERERSRLVCRSMGEGHKDRAGGWKVARTISNDV